MRCRSPPSTYRSRSSSGRTEIGTQVSYLSPTALGTRYGLSPDLAAKLAGIDPLTDALVG